MWHENCLCLPVPFRSFFCFFAALTLLASLQARAGAAGEIRVEYCDGFLWMKVHVAGQREPFNFILDSGAAASVLDLGAAKRLGVKLGGRVSVQGVHSSTTARRIDHFEAQAAGITLPESLLAIDLSAVSKTCDRPIDGLLGADFFLGRIVQIDFAAGRLRLLDQGQSSARCMVLPMKTRNGTFCVPVGVAGNPPQWMRVDTGCDSALEWAASGTKSRRGSGTSIGLTSARAGSISTDVQLGGRTLRQVRTGVHEQQMFPGEAGLLGNALLARFRVTFDAPGGRLLLESR